ncbi:hypothetical protein [Paenibacillus glycinis]|uniref:Flagellar protein FliT n=1 Tax=Paenibacillus glycinis TaxID=2697035 RepID=A0ABW9XVJ8_9BACL|nr:hypothetical protein [Paenibacillus glycinis]NBD26708.1 hypothetical protein [Paenibacillus glycinis]
MSESALAALYRETVAIMSQLDQGQQEQFEQLIASRERALAELQAGNAVGETDRAIIRELSSYDKKIMKRMQELRDDASMRINKIQVSKLQKRVYDSDAFEGGAFFDKKK